MYGNLDFFNFMVNVGKYTGPWSIWEWFETTN